VHVYLKAFKGPFGSRIRRGGEGKDFNGGEGRGYILIKNVFGSQGEGRGGGGILKLFYCFTLKLN